MMDNAGVAQAVEHLPCNQDVPRSNRGASTTDHDSTEWDKFYPGEEAMRGAFDYFERMVKAAIVEADKILELGAGLGPNIPFLSEIGEYYGIEGSAKAVKYMHDQYPNMKDRIALADFSCVQPFGTGFDAIVERASVPHNDITAIRRTLGLVWASLKPGGLFVSSDWFSMNHSESSRGRVLEQGPDGRTATAFVDGQFNGIEKVHFSGIDELTDLFGWFDRIAIQERIVRRKGPGFAPGVVKMRWISSAFDNEDYDTAVWDIVVRKPL